MSNKNLTDAQIKLYPASGVSRAKDSQGNQTDFLRFEIYSDELIKQNRKSDGSYCERIMSYGKHGI